LSPSSPFRGSIVALATPFAATSEREIDFSAFCSLIEFQLERGCDGLVIGGTTGEAATLTERERVALFEFATGVVRKRVPVIAGIGSSSTRATCKLAREALRVGVDGLLVVTPSYNRPSQEGLVAHYAEIACATHLPLVLYNVPARTAVDLLPATVARIAAANPTVVAIKEASNSLERIHELVALGSIDVLCGDDRWIADALEMGAVGLIGVVSNLVPEMVWQLVHSFDEGSDRSNAPGYVESLTPLIRALGLETNPTPLKAALAHTGLCGEAMRLPLVPISEENRKRLEEALAFVGLGS
jgi:4-hydroxy-tetrahydrodipicolinate synthase